MDTEARATRATSDCIPTLHVDTSPPDGGPAFPQIQQRRVQIRERGTKTTPQKPAPKAQVRALSQQGQTRIERSC